MKANLLLLLYNFSLFKYNFLIFLNTLNQYILIFNIFISIIYIMISKNIINTIDDTNIFKLFDKITKPYNNLEFEIFHFENNKLLKVYGKNYILKCILNSNTELPNLVLLAGFSNKSIINSSKVLLENIDKIKNKYQAVYIYCYSEKEFKKHQFDACSIRDQKKNENYKEIEKIYESEIKLNDKLGIFIDKCLRSPGLNLTNVHLLGKCAGGGLAIHTITKSNIYSGLLLAVPASPLNVLKLKKLNNIQKNNIRFIFTWEKNDDYPFDWNKKSNQEKEYYDKTMKKLKIKNYESYIFDEEPKNKSEKYQYHEISNSLFDKI
jgi:hypothetical protein